MRPSCIAGFVRIIIISFNEKIEKEEYKMILFITLFITLAILLACVMIITIVGGVTALLAFGDVIIFCVIVWFIVRFFIRRKKK